MLVAAGAVRAAENPASVLISRQLAEGEHLGVGDIVRLAAAADGSGAREFRIAGIYEPTPDPVKLGAVIREVRLHLPDLLELTPSIDDAVRRGIVEPHLDVVRPVTS